MGREKKGNRVEVLPGGSQPGLPGHVDIPMCLET